jgi:hypothetical protein
MIFIVVLVVLVISISAYVMYSLVRKPAPCVWLYITGSHDTAPNLINTWAKQCDPSLPLRLTADRDKANYFLVLNRPHVDDDDTVDKNKSKTFLARMEPNMKTDVKRWGEWADPDRSQFLYVMGFEDGFNLVEWHLNFDYTTLLNTDFSEQKTMGNAVSVIVSSLTDLPGHVQRIKFIRYIQKFYADTIQLHVYGKDDLNNVGIRDQIKSLPVADKSDGLVPYRYHFASENSYTDNYVTEKFYDPVLCNTFVFYAGAPNVCDMYGSTGFKYLDLVNNDYKTCADMMVESIARNVYEAQAQNLRELKEQMLKNYSISPRLCRVLTRF